MNKVSISDTDNKIKKTKYAIMVQENTWLQEVIGIITQVKKVN